MSGNLLRRHLRNLDIANFGPCRATARIEPLGPLPRGSLPCLGVGLDREVLKVIDVFELHPEMPLAGPRDRVTPDRRRVRRPMIRRQTASLANPLAGHDRELAGVDPIKDRVLGGRIGVDVALQNLGLLPDAERVTDHVPNRIEDHLPTRVAVIDDTGSHRIERRGRVVLTGDGRDVVSPERITEPKQRLVVPRGFPVTRPHLPQPPCLAISRRQRGPSIALQVGRRLTQRGQHVFRRSGCPEFIG